MHRRRRGRRGEPWGRRYAVIQSVIIAGAMSVSVAAAASIVARPHAVRHSLVLSANAAEPRTAAASPSASASSRPATAPTIGQRVTGPGIVRILTVAAHDRESRHVWLYRPAVADAAALPVLYLLHGVPGSYLDFAAHAGLKGFLDWYFRHGAQPFLVAVPDGNSHVRSDTEWADSVDGRDLLDTFVTHDVVVAVEGDHPRPARLRAIAGFSMGGYGAANLALRHAGMFGQVVSLAGYFHIDDPSGVFAGRTAAENANNPTTLVRAEPAASRAIRWLLLDGDSDTEPAVEGELQRFVPVLQAAHAPVVDRITTGTHNYQWVRTQWQLVANFLEEGWR